MLCFPPAGAMIQPLPALLHSLGLAMMLAPHMGGPPMMPVMVPLPHGMMSVGPAPRKRPPMEDKPMMSGPSMKRPYPHPIIHWCPLCLA